MCIYIDIDRKLVRVEEENEKGEHRKNTKVSDMVDEDVTDKAKPMIVVFHEDWFTFLILP